MNNTSPFFYGKLPAYADFVSYGNEGPAAVRFEKWVREGMHLIGHSYIWDQVYRNAEGFDFFYPDAGQVLMGRLWPSVDRVGRKYPFWAGVSLSKYQLNVPALLTEYSVFYTELEKAFPNGIAQVQLDQLPKLLEKLSKVLVENDAFHTFAQNISINDFAKETFGPHNPVSFDSQLLYISECLKPLAMVSPATFRLGLRMPLGLASRWKTAYPHFVRGWLDLVMVLSGLKETFTPVFFWTPPSGKIAESLTLFFSPPLPDKLPILLDPAREHDLVSDVNKGAVYMELHNTGSHGFMKQNIDGESLHDLLIDLWSLTGIKK